MPAVALLDQRGRAFSFAETGGRTTIVSFVYTRCGDADMCPLVAAKFARMQQLIGETPLRLVTVTLDPSFDTQPVLEQYGQRYGARAATWSLVTGPVSRVNELVARFGIVNSTPRAGSVAHTEAALVLDDRGRVARIIDGATWLPEDLVAVADEVAHIDNSPLRRLHLWLASSASALCGGRGSTPLTVAAGLFLFAATLTALALVFRRLLRPAPAPR